MISINEIFALLLVGAGLWFWWDTLRVRERAQQIAVGACRRAGMQFLDGTVALRRLWVARDGQGRLRPLRYYVFEFSDTGANRRSGEITLVGLTQRYLYMDLPEGPTITTERLSDDRPRLH